MSAAAPEGRVGPHVAGALAAMFAAAAAVIVWAGRDLTFYGDDWSFIGRRLGSGADVYLEPHNEHLSAVPVAFYKTLFAIAGLDHPGAFRAVLLGAHLLCAALIFVYVRRRVGAVAAALACALILFLGQAWEILFVAIGIGYLGSLVTGVAMLLMLDRRTHGGDVAASLLLALAIASSSLGLPLAAGALVEALLDPRRRRRVLVVVLPLMLYALWFVAYREDPTRGVDLTGAPAFVADVAAGGIGGLTGVAVVSDHLDGALHWLVTVEHLLAALALAALVWVVATRRLEPRAWMLVTTLASFWVVLAVLRAGGGEGFGTAVSPYSSRYVYPSAVLIVLLATELAREWELGGRRRTALALAVAAVSAANTVWLVVSTDDLRRQAALTRADLTAIEIMRDEVRPGYVPGGEVRNANVQAGPYLRAVRELGSSPAYAPGELLDAPEPARRAADRSLIRIQGIGWLGPVRPGRGAISLRAETTNLRPSGRDGCLAGDPRRPAVLELALPREGVTLPSVPPRPVAVRFRRFAEGFGDSVGSVREAVAIRPSLGRLETTAWHARLSSPGGFTACPAAERP